MLQPHQAYSSASLAQNGEVVTKLTALCRGGALTIVGLGQGQLGEVLSQTSSLPHMLRLDFVGVANTAVAIERILDDLADLAAALWPDWDRSESPTPLPRLAAWRRAASRFASAGRRPRFRRLPRETEAAHLLSVIPRLVLLAEVDPLRSERAAPIIAALEWCRRHGAAVVALLAKSLRLRRLGTACFMTRSSSTRCWSPWRAG
jgi:hypothetical protein